MATLESALEKEFDMQLVFSHTACKQQTTLKHGLPLLFYSVFALDRAASHA